MKYYTVKDISAMLSVDRETVRRWIRAGELKSTMISRKKGNIISEEFLEEFFNEYPKYRPLDPEEVREKLNNVRELAENIEKNMKLIEANKKLINSAIKNIKTLEKQIKEQKKYLNGLAKEKKQWDM